MKKIHFVGIGGIGLSALARYMQKQGYIISGSDLKQTPLIKALKKQNIIVNYPHDKNNINNQDMVVHTSIAQQSNEELVEARNKNITTLSRKDFIPYITKEKKVFSVCGAHGKSTISAMLCSILQDYDALIGAQSKEFDSNMRFKNSQNLIFEADESDKSFLNSNPYYAIVPNAEPEHMEAYDYDYDYFYKCYENFINSAKYAIINAEDEFLKTLNYKHLVKLYPSKDIKNIQTTIKNNEPFTSFELKDYGVFEVFGVGEHIALNASLAILTAIDILSIQQIKENLLLYKGIKKRFDILYKKSSIIIDDYAHHPTEIQATLSSLKTYNSLVKKNKIIAIWQPHKYSRTIDNLDAFINSFKDCDELIILPVYSTNEKKIDIDFEKLFARYSPVMADYISTKNSKVFIYKNDKIIKTLENDIVIGLGAGDITYQLRSEI